MEKVKVITGDTGVTPYGGGTWASRGAGIGGEAVLQAGRALRSNILDVAAAILKADKAELDIAGNARDQQAHAGKEARRWPSSAASPTSARTRCRWTSSPSSP